MTGRLLFAGSANMDIVLSCDRAPQEGETVMLRSKRNIPGGKGANKAVAAARLGAPTAFSCCVGEDAFGEQLLKIYENERIDISLSQKTDRAETGNAFIFVESSGKNRIAVDAGANGLYGSVCLNRVIEPLVSFSMLCLENEIPTQCVKKLKDEAIARGIPVVIDAGPVTHATDKTAFEGAFILTPNEAEAELLTGVCVRDDESAKEACRELYRLDAKYVVLKLGARGSLCFDGREFFACPAIYCGKTVDTTAAGDCFTAALCCAVNEGKDIKTAMSFATAAAGISVTRKGALPSLPTRAEIAKYLA